MPERVTLNGFGLMQGNDQQFTLTRNVLIFGNMEIFLTKIMKDQKNRGRKMHEKLPGDPNLPPGVTDKDVELSCPDCGSGNIFEFECTWNCIECGENFQLDD